MAEFTSLAVAQPSQTSVSRELERFENVAPVWISQTFIKADSPIRNLARLAIMSNGLGADYI